MRLLEIHADIICPWCYIGRHRLAQAMLLLPRSPLEIRWRPFQLNPEMPPGGMDRAIYLVAKFGGFEQARQVWHAIGDAVTRDGLPLDQEAIRRTPNTMDAHRLILLAGKHGLESEVVDKLHTAYFVEGMDIGDREILVSIAEFLGIPHRLTTSYLEGADGIDEVISSDAQARKAGIRAVPFFVFNKRFAIAGAHSPETFLPLLELL